MSLLAWLTLGYAAVLVLALAVSLSAIAVQLRRTGKLLGEAKDALLTVQDRTAGLEGPLAALRDTCGALARDFETAETVLGAADRRLESRLERLGLGRLAAGGRP